MCFNSNAMSFVIHEKGLYFWYGKYSTEKERSFEGSSFFNDEQLKSSFHPHPSLLFF